jgi:hypothetical protein
VMMNHPLEQTLARARELNEYLKPQLGAPSGEGWIAHTDLAPGAARLEALIAATQARLRTKAAAIVGSAVLQSYQWPLISTAVVCYLLNRRVPDLRPEATRTRYNAEHEADALALLGGRFTALPGDSAASHPDATVVADLLTLRTVLRTGIEAHLGAVIDQLCAHLGCKGRGLWLNVADSLAGTFVWLAQEQQPVTTLEQLEAEVAALIRSPGSPLHNRRIGLIQLSHQERSQVFLDRATCCYWYKTEGGEYCSTCPHRTPEDRRERLLRYLAEEQPQQDTAAQEETLV